MRENQIDVYMIETNYRFKEKNKTYIIIEIGKTPIKVTLNQANQIMLGIHNIFKEYIQCEKQN